ncbi:MAG: TraB/GumN family protein [Proteobacteria bacterium]|nr:TraB/GumN family protein [Pseudomonadota bacterium]
MRCIVIAGLLVLSPLARAQSAAPPAQLQTITVTGEQPGPGLWKVTKGDHVLWILGTVSPLPRDIQWKSKELDERIAQSQELITASGIGVKADVGFFGTLVLLPSLIGIRNNPDGRHLDEVLPPDLYARWVAAKRKYIGHSNRVEKWRPIFAALKLYEAAMDRNRLTGADYVAKQVRVDAKRKHLAIVTPQVMYSIKEPRARVKEFKSAPMADIDCLRKTLARIDADLANMTARANAWAVGDIDALRALPQSDQWSVCLAAVSESGIARKQGMTDVQARLDAAWIDAARTALENNASTVAMVNLRHLLDADGYLARLTALGFTVEMPAGDSMPAAVQASVGPAQGDHAIEPAERE